MEEERSVTIYLATEIKFLNVPYLAEWTVEDICIAICKQLEIGPLARHLFALRGKSNKLWIPAGHKLETHEKNKFEFRLRFKPSSLKRLKLIDSNAYNYYFHQVRCDVLENKVADIVYEKHKRELIGLGVSDMYRVIVEKQIPREVVEGDYKKYIPKECIKRHSFFIKKPIHNALARISGHDAAYVKEQYLNQFEVMAPNYPYEEYKALMDKNLPDPASRILLRVNPSEVMYYELDVHNQWTTLCAIEDLCSISIGQDNTVEVSRKSGIPSYLKFSTNALLMSFVSALDGYYRLAVKWTFNLCRDIITPSLEKLHKMKCHGPVGGEFSYAKLKEKRSNKSGTYILRECEKKYNVFWLDSCGKDHKPRTYKIEQLGPESFIISESVQTYKSITHIVSSFNDSEQTLYLSECLPPSEYDKSPLLICAMTEVCNDVAADEEIITALLEGEPRVIPSHQLQIYKANPFPEKNSKTVTIGQGSFTSVYRAMWRVTKGKKLEAAIKVLRDEKSRYAREFFELAGKWGQLRSSALVRLYGLTVSPTVGMLMELIKLGPLDVYLQSKSAQSIKTVDMVEASACLANALWHLEENGFVHGNIRCRKLLVHVHSDTSFIIKLANPGLFFYTQADIHWLPPETYDNPEEARRSTRADVWALGTTLWQIFSRGAALPVNRDIDSIKRFYLSGKRLPIPAGCPAEVYKLMTECWGDLSRPRKQPQAIMRDIHQILYQIYHSRRSHAYATVFPKSFSDRELTDESEIIDNSSSDCESRASSIFTDRTSLPWDDPDDSAAKLIQFNDTDNDAEEELSLYLGRLAGVGGIGDGGAGDNLGFSCLRDATVDLVNSLNESSGHNGGPLGQMQGIFELDADCNVILQGKIGQGFYGEVFRGILERDNAKDIEPQLVAVKKLKTRAVEADLRDFEREISIMKTLNHPNVVKILGVISEPEVCLVMEFVKHGSLQSYLAIHRENLTHKRLLEIALNISTGMDYLGRQSIVHRDLAARNILVSDDSTVKISDFGLAQVTGSNDYYILQTNRDLPIKWYAPESLRDGKFSPRSDVWSFGVTMYETFGLGEDPKLPGVGGQQGGDSAEEGGAALLAALERGTRLPCPQNCPQIVYVKLMYPCWHLQSHLRPDFAMLCNEIRDLITQY
ncbi:GSCOCT00000409001.2-RA-CDS [Cotesia congregata]|uniref:non-specific protein-tyrosine kinase n=1 Tax=Cotesia congregata TaxID=51543 RepID=A0A8J2MFE8_COTCN|nr:GSCOCT00000409001.2-RA-CDS [Cotesia congregata]CAG5088111.1 Hopscotch_JAKSTATpathway_Cc [Cotesia congregata]